MPFVSNRHRGKDRRRRPSCLVLRPVAEASLSDNLREATMLSRQ
jgi:hypothetical protein